MGSQTYSFHGDDSDESDYFNSSFGCQDFKKILATTYGALKSGIEPYQRKIAF